MKKVFKTFFDVIKSYSIEDKVLSVVAAGLVIYASFKVVLMLGSGGGVVAENSAYTEGYVSNRPVIVSPLYMDFSTVNRDISSLVFSGLLKYDPASKSFVDDLATLKVSGDQKIYSFTLKDNVFFQDGKPITADDVVFTFQDIIESPEFQNPVLKSDLSGVKITKVDERTVTFEIAKPNSFFITDFSVGILPKHFLENVAVTDLPTNEFNQKPVGSGPYQLTKIETTADGVQRIELSLSPNYHGVKPKIKQIKFYIYPDEDSLSKDRVALNVISKLSLNEDQSLETDPRFQKFNYSLPQYTGVFFNTDDPVLKEKKIRVGLIKSVDKDVLLGGLAGKLKVDTPLMELNQKDWIYKTNEQDAVNSFSEAGYSFPKDAAGNVLAEEKYLKNKEGKILELTLIARQFDEGSLLESNTKATTESLVKFWEKAGVKVNVQFLGEENFSYLLETKEYQMVLAGQTMGYNLDTFPFWHSSQAKENGQNLSNYRNQTADSLIERVRGTIDTEEKSLRLTKLASVIAADAPALFLYRPEYQFLTDGKVKGIKLDNWSFTADRFLEIANWCVGKDCAQ